MQRDRHRRIKDLFLQALDLEGDAQERFLLDHAGDEGELLDEVRRMLSADAEAGGEVEAVDLLGVLDRSRAPGAVPERIGQFTIERIVGQGGMGVVYEAWQDAPRRRVALKVMQSAVASEAARTRFAREAELLGRLQHRGIAQVITSGSWKSPGGVQPFLVMEFIEGASITEHASVQGLGDRARIELVAQVADAVEHAHQRSVVHRDLKPANVLVTAEGEAKVLDFGVARAVEVEMEVAGGQTQTGQVVGTPAYMSPEQAAGEFGIVDARTDVHALGAMLYELLTGTLPREADGSITKALATLRDTPARRLRARRPELRGDLDTVLGKALESEVSDRYATAASFAADLRRYLDDRPIEARPPSAVYQFRKFARRNRLVVVGGLAIVVLLVLGLGGTLWGLGLSIEQRDEARREAVKANTVLTFVQDMLASVKPEESLGADVRMAAILEEAAATLDDSTGREPEVEAALRLTIGTTFLSLSRFDEALAQLERAVALRRVHLGDVHLDTAWALYQLGRLRLETRRLSEARAAYTECLSIRRQLLEAPHGDIALALDGLGSAERRSGNVEAAEAHLEESLGMREALADGADKGLAVTLGHLGQLRQQQSRFEEAEELFRRGVAMNEELYPEDYPDVATSRNNLASLLHDRGKYDEADEMYRQALASFRAVYGEQHLAVAHCLNNHASLLQARGEFEDAEELFLESLALRQRLVGEESVSAAVLHNNLGVLYAAMKDFTRAKASYLRAAAIREDQLDPGHPDIVQTRNNLAAVRYYENDYRGAADEFQAALEQMEAAHEEMTWDISTLRMNLCNCLMAAGDHEAGLDAVQPAYAWRLQELGPTHTDTCYSADLVGNGLRALGRFDEAEQIFRDNWERMQESESVDDVARIRSLRLRCRLYEAWGKPEELARWKAELDKRTAEKGGG